MSGFAPHLAGLLSRGGVETQRAIVDHAAALRAHRCCSADVDREGYLSALQYPTAAITSLARKQGGAVGGYAGSLFADRLCFDIDREGDLGEALAAVRRLYHYLTLEIELPHSAILVHYSGSKGFHLDVPTALWSPQPGPLFGKTARAFCQKLAKDAEASPIDAAVFSAVQPLRLPNTIHQRTKLRKRLIPGDDILRMSLAAILEAAKKPLPYTVDDQPVELHERLVDRWREATEDAARASTEESNRRRAVAAGGAQVTESLREYISGDLLPESGSRHNTLLGHAARMAELGVPLEATLKFLQEPAEDNGISPKDARRHICNGWEIGTRNLAGGDS